MLKDQLEISFYNTIDASGSEILKFQSDAKSQESMVLEAFNKRSEMAWFEVQGFLPEMNRESLKRCLSVLKNKGKLLKTKVQVMGVEGKNCYRYQLIKPIN